MKLKDFINTIVTAVITTLLVATPILFFLVDSKATPIQDNVIYFSGGRCELFEQIKNISIANANLREYILYRYDCTDFSRQLVKDLKKINISAYCVFGDYDKNFVITKGLIGHTWVQFQLNNKTYNIEATTGELISDSKMNKSYRIFSKGVCA